MKRNSDASAKGKSRERSLSANEMQATWMQLYELPSGRPLGDFNMEEEMNVCDFDAKQNLVVACSPRFSASGKLQLYTLDKELVLKKNILAIDKDDFPEILSARFLTEGKLAVCLREKLIVLNLESLKPVFFLPISDVDWRLANDRRHAIVEHEGRKIEVDLVEGKCLAVIGTKKFPKDGTPSPDGKRVAQLSNRIVTISSRSGGKIEDEFHVPIRLFHHLTWLDDQTLRVTFGEQEEFLVDVKQRVALLQVMKSSLPQGQEGWSVEKNREDEKHPFYMISSKHTEHRGELPSLEECRERLGKEKDDLLLFRKGDRLALKVDFQAESGIAGEARNRVEKILSERGVVVDDSAQDELRLTCLSKEHEVHRVREMSPLRNGNTSPEKIMVKVVSSSLEFVRDGEVVWAQRCGSRMPENISTGSLAFNKSPQQQVDERNIKPSVFWKSVRLPRHVAEHPNGLPWARYRKTGLGYEEIQ